MIDKRVIKNNEVFIFPSAKDLFQFAARDFMERALTSVKDKDIFSVVLSGGNTPKAFYDALVEIDHQKKIPWGKMLFFFGDERYVPADKIDSNYHMAQQYLFSKVSLNPKNIYRIPTELENPPISAQHYEESLRKIFHLNENELPLFDLVYLGLGDDGHTASLMPFNEVVKKDAQLITQHNHQNHQLVTAVYISKLNRYRITLTPLALNAAKEIIFLVTGASKAPAVWEVLKGKWNPERFPAQLIQCKEMRTKWYIDQSASKKLNARPSDF